MAAEVINGADIAKQVRAEVAEQASPPQALRGSCRAGPAKGLEVNDAAGGVARDPGYPFGEG